jgi:hypothetical protein
MHTQQMTPAQWAQVQDNPIQRDTEAHASKAIRTHLNKYSPTHAAVAAAVLPSGEMYKLDGHTRSLLWSSGKLEAPGILTVAIYQAKDIEEVQSLYKCFDSASACENSKDKLAGAFRLHGIAAQSGLLRHGGLTTALSIITQSKNIYENVLAWRSEIELLDELGFANNAFPTGLLVAALMAARKHGRKSLEFWRLYAQNAGTRINGKSDGVDELCRVIAVKRAARQLAANRAVSIQLAERAISCLETWLKSGTYAGGSKSTDLRKYIAKA